MKTVIEINGRKYDARTGQIVDLSNGTTNARQPQKASPAAPVLDGVSRRRGGDKPQQNASHHPRIVRNTSLKSHNREVKSSLDFNGSGTRTQKAKTLLRTAVKKPANTVSLIHSTTGALPSQLQQSATGRGLLLKRAPAERMARAKQTAPSNKISHFDAQTGVKKPRLSVLPVAQAPSEMTPPGAPPLLGKFFKDKKSSQREHVFNHSIAHATNHKAQKVPKPKLHTRVAKSLQVQSKTLGVGAAVLAILLLGSFLAYQKVPSIAIRVAANRAGFDGRLPSNVPAGFSFKGPIKYTKGFIGLKYKSNSDDRNFLITQKPTELNSESLLTSYLIGSKLRYQTYHDRGLTVFVYNESDATWVDKGVWYSLTGDGSLSSDQILGIAASM